MCSAGGVKELDVAEYEEFGPASRLDFEVLAAPIGKEEGGANKECCECCPSIGILLVGRLVHEDEMLWCHGLLSLYRWVDVLPSLQEGVDFGSKLRVVADRDVAGAFPAVCPEALHQLAKGFADSVAS